MDLNIVQDAFLDELNKVAADLTQAAREHIKTKNFALNAKQSDTGAPKYPIEDRSHAANALARVKQHGTPAEKAEVYKDVARKYPDMAAKSDVPEVRARAKHAGIDPLQMKAAVEVIKQATFSKAKALKAMLEEGGPALGATLGAGVAAGYDKPALSGAAIGYGVGALPELTHGKLWGKHKK